MFVYETPDGKEHVALTVGPVGGEEPALARLHSECMTGDVFGSRRCDCGEQLEASMKMLQERGRGILLYLRQEGRGIGLTMKTYAYALQEQGIDTVEANLALGLPEDARDYRFAAGILRDLGVKRVCLITNNPSKVEGLNHHGIEVAERIPLEVTPNPSNQQYMLAKREKMGHLLNHLPHNGERQNRHER